MDAKTAKLFFIKEIVCFLLGEQKDTPSLSPDSSLNSDPPSMECQLELTAARKKGRNWLNPNPNPKVACSKL